MNERIEQLALQANELDYETFDEYNHKTVQHYKFNKEKFAELIVKECVTVGQDAFLHGSTVPVFPTIQIKRHFGVEE